MKDGLNSLSLKIVRRTTGFRFIGIFRGSFISWVASMADYEPFSMRLS